MILRAIAALHVLACAVGILSALDAESCRAFGTKTAKAKIKSNFTYPAAERTAKRHC